MDKYRNDIMKIWQVKTIKARQERKVNYEEIFIYDSVTSDHRTCRMSEGSDNKVKAEDEYK